MLFAPVHTILPDLKTNAAVFGFVVLYTNPGNCFGSYSATSNLSASDFKSNSCPIAVDATTFSILMVFFAASDLDMIAPPHR